MLAASAAFRAAGSPTIAGDVVGAMLTRWHYISLLAPLLLFVLELRRVRSLVLSLLFAALMLAAAQSFVDLRIRAIRNASPFPVSERTADDPLRRQFGALHGVSMTLLLLQALTAAAVVMSRDRVEPEVVAAPRASAPPAAAPPDHHEPYSPTPPEPRVPEETSGGGP